jgi:hypothetical protein
MNSSEDTDDCVDPPQRQTGRLRGCGEDGDSKVTPTPKRRRLPIVDVHSLGRVIATAEGQLRDPPGFFFSAMPMARTLQSAKSRKEEGTGSARKSRAKAAEMAAKARDEQGTGALDCAPGGDQVAGPSGQGKKGAKDCSPPEIDKNVLPIVPVIDIGSAEVEKEETGESSDPGEHHSHSSAESQTRDETMSGEEGDDGKRPTIPHRQESGGGEKGEEAVDNRSRRSSNSSSSPTSMASLSLGSDTDFLSDSYVIMDPEAKRNGTVVFASLVSPGMIQNLTQTLGEEVVERTVFFPVFTRYFLAKGKVFENMLADLLRHCAANQNGGPPLILRDDVPRIRNIAYKRMGFLRKTYKRYKDSPGPVDETNMALIRLHMKACVSQYHAVLPQLDLIATQWGVQLEDTWSQDDLGSLRTDSSRRKRQEVLDDQLRSQLRDVRRHEVGEEEVPVIAERRKTTSSPKDTAKKSSGIQSKEVERLLEQNKEERRKRRTTEDMLSKAEEDC